MQPNSWQQSARMVNPKTSTTRKTLVALRESVSRLPLATKSESTLVASSIYAINLDLSR